LNNISDGKQDRNIEDILQEAAVLMQETIPLQPPNLHLETSTTSRSHSPNNRSSTQKIGKDTSSLPHKKTEDTYSSLGRSKVSLNESKGILKELSVSSSVSFESNPSKGRKAHSNELKTKEEERKPFYLHDQSSARGVPDLNRTFLINPAVPSQTNPKNSTSKISSSADKPLSKESSECTRRRGTVKKGVLTQSTSHMESNEDSEEKCFREYMSKNPAKSDRESVLSSDQQEELARKAEEMYTKLNEEIKLEIEQIIKSKAAKLDGVGTPIQTPILNGDFPNLKLSYPGLDTPSVEVPSCFNLEKEFLEERKRCLKLKGNYRTCASVMFFFVFFNPSSHPLFLQLISSGLDEFTRTKLPNCKSSTTKRSSP